LLPEKHGKKQKELANLNYGH